MLRLCAIYILGNTYWSLVTRICICPLHCFSVLFFVMQQPISDLGRLIVEVLRSHTGSVDHFWTRDRLVEETATWQHTASTGDRHPCPGGIRTRSPNKRPAADGSATRIGFCIVDGYLHVQLGMRIWVGLSGRHSCRWDVPRYCALLLLIVYVNPEMVCGVTYMLTHRCWVGC